MIEKLGIGPDGFKTVARDADGNVMQDLLVRGTNIVPSHLITFTNKDNKEVGRFDFNGPQMKFIGDPDEAAEMFIQYAGRSFQRRLDTEWNAAIDAAAKQAQSIVLGESHIAHAIRGLKK